MQNGRDRAARCGFATDRGEAGLHQWIAGRHHCQPETSLSDQRRREKGPAVQSQNQTASVDGIHILCPRASGNSRRGQQIFKNANGVNCIRCHRINGQGGLVGPELTGIGTKQNRAYIIESVLYPSKVILDGYQQVFFYMTDDEDYAGIVHSETADEVTLIDSLGKTNVLEKSKIKSRKISKISLMPEGLQTVLSLEDFSDLITFVEKSGPGTPPGSPAEMAALPPNSPLPEPTRKGTEPAPSDPLDFLNLPLLPFATPAVPAAPPTSIAPPMPVAPAAHVVRPKRPRSGPRAVHPAEMPPTPPSFSPPMLEVPPAPASRANSPPSGPRTNHPADMPPAPPGFPPAPAPP